MPVGGTPLRRMGFLTIGLFDPDDPAAGHETTRQIIELGERRGFDSAWLRHRHLQFGISSPSRCWPRPPSAPGASSWAPRSRRWTGRTRCGSWRTGPPSTCAWPVRRPVRHA